GSEDTRAGLIVELACQRGNALSADAEQLFLEAVALVGGRHLPYELKARASFAEFYAAARRPEEAVPHLERCRDIMAAGEDWRGLAGRVARAEALVASYENLDRAGEQFHNAIQIHRRYQLPFEECHTLVCHAEVSFAAGDTPGAI